MSEPDPNAEAEQLTQEDVVSFFDAKKVTSICPTCSTGSWSVIVPANDGLIQLPLVKGRQLTGRSIPTIIAICNNCGYERAHSVLKVLEWKKQGAPHG